MDCQNIAEVYVVVCMIDKNSIVSEDWLLNLELTNLLN